VNVFEMIAFVALMTAIASVLSGWLKHRSARAPDEEGRVARLEERVKVLERIVTDSGYDLRRQFRDLERNA
jgi:hypothetical protein